MANCTFNRAWIGPCGKECDSDFCELHAGSLCCSCGKQATRECDHTGIQFVCGAPLCDDCQHGRPKEGQEGWFLLGGGHVTKEVHKTQWPEVYDAD